MPRDKKRVNFRALVLSFFASSALYATQEFTLESMKKHITEENPYIYSALAKQYIAKEKLAYSRGAFDTKAVAKYDEKEYPVTDGKLYSASLTQPTESGVDLSAGYRYAEGTQEYNNIKTADNGEFIVGAKIPLVSVLNRMDERRLRVALMQMDLKNSEFEYKEDMRRFYFTLMSEYYTLLYNKSLLHIAKEMLQKMQKRYEFLESNVARGNMPEVALFEARQQLIHSEQEYMSTQRNYDNSFVEFLKYINLTQEAFETRYHIPLLPEVQTKEFVLEESLKEARERRGDISILNTEVEKLLLQNRNNERKKYPELDIGLYGVYDTYEQSGFKLTLDLSLPIQRSQYKAKTAEIRESIKAIKNAKEIRLIELKADLKKIINSINTLKINLKNAQEESELLEKLESAERRKYELGSSTLFILNQREMRTMQTKKRVLQYKLEYHLLYESYRRIMSFHTLQS